jgi:hypothetical protein
MKKEIFIHAKEVATELGISEAHAYKLVRVMNAELKRNGFIVISGRVSRAYFNEKVYGSKKGGDKHVSI